MPHMRSNIPFTNFCGFVISVFLFIAKCTLRTNVFLSRASNLFSKMIVKDGNRAILTKRIKKFLSFLINCFSKN